MGGFYGYLVPCHVLDDAARNLLCFQLVWVEDGNVHGAEFIFHLDERLAFLAICELFLFPSCSFGGGLCFPEFCSPEAASVRFLILDGWRWSMSRLWRTHIFGSTCAFFPQ